MMNMKMFTNSPVHQPLVANHGVSVCPPLTCVLKACLSAFGSNRHQSRGLIRSSSGSHHELFVTTTIFIFYAIEGYDQK